MIPTPLIDAKGASEVLDEVVVLDARVGPEAQSAFEAAHVRGAVRVDLERDLSAPADPAQGGRHPLPHFDVWLARVGGWGITPETPVVIYDAESGGMAAARAWWMLCAVGHDLVAVVDGGWRSLIEAGVPMVSARSNTEPESRYPSKRPGWPTVDASLVDRIRRDPEWTLLDARAPERYRGEVEPLDPVPGHIPGAQNLFWRSLLGADGCFMPRDQLAKHYDAVRGDVTPEHIVCYCGSGVTACHLLLGLQASGMAGAQLYVGSWSEWCRINPP